MLKENIQDQWLRCTNNTTRSIGDEAMAMVAMLIMLAGIRIRILNCLSLFRTNAWCVAFFLRSMLEFVVILVSASTVTCGDNGIINKSEYT